MKKEKCRVCFEPIEDGGFKGMNCKHQFHEECLKAYALQCEKNQKAHFCPDPYCRVPYNYKELLSAEVENRQRVQLIKTQLEEYRSQILCSICYEDYTQEKPPASLISCPMHIFHEKCLRDLLTQCKVIKCPLDNKPFEEHHIKPRMDILNKLLQLEAKLGPKYKIRVDDLLEKQVTIDINKETTVEEFVEICVSKLEFPRQDYFFIFKDKAFSYKNSEKRLSEYGIVENSLIQVLFDD